MKYALLRMMILLVPACGGTSLRRQKVVVLPLRGIGVPPKVTSRIHQRISARLTRRNDLRVVRPPRGLRAAKGARTCDSATVPGRQRCAASAARMAGASRALTGALGGLGHTYLLQLATVDRTGRVLNQIERSFTSSSAQLARIIAPLADEMLPPTKEPQRRQKSWYSNWWVWTIAGAVATAAAVAIITPLALADDSPAYVDLPLP